MLRRLGLRQRLRHRDRRLLRVPVLRGLALADESFQTVAQPWRAPGEAAGALPVAIEEQSLEQGDALKAEIESFLGCIRTGRPPVVSGEAGLMALETAMRITDQVHQSLAERAAARSKR